MALGYGTSSNITARMEGPFGGSGGSGAKISGVTLYAESWKNAESPYFQDVVIDGVSASSMVRIHATKEQIVQMHKNGIAIHVDNDGGITTAYAIGAKPAEDMTFQVSIEEVLAL